AYLGALVRHEAGIHTPCSRATLISVVEEEIRFLSEGGEHAPDVEHAVEQVISLGDLLELDNVATEDVGVKGSWVFPAPAAFVVRRSGSALLLGVLRDSVSPLPGTMNARIRYEGFSRIVLPEDGEDLASFLQSLGLLSIKESTWLKSPRSD